MTDAAHRTNVKVHFFYVTLILGLCIIALVTFDWTRLQGFTEYLSVAATVTSLVLGILAIIYGSVSSDTISHSLGAVETSSSKITQIAAELKAVLDSGQRAQARAEVGTSQLHGLIDEMRQGLASLSETTQRIEGSVEAIPDKINLAKSLAPTDTPAADDPAPTPADQSVRWDCEQLKSLIRRASPIGRVAIYAAWIATKQDKYVDFSSLVGANLYSYVYGFLIGVSSSGAVQLEYATKDKSFSAVRLKAPRAEWDEVLELLWAKREESKNKTWIKVAAKYGPKIESALVDGPAAPEPSGEVI